MLSLSYVVSRTRDADLTGFPFYSEGSVKLPDLEALESAAELVHAVMPPTPQIRWPLLCARAGAEVWVKHENHTPVGAFKLRGGMATGAKKTRPCVHLAPN